MRNMLRRRLPGLLFPRKRASRSLEWNTTVSLPMENGLPLLMLTSLECSTALQNHYDQTYENKALWSISWSFLISVFLTTRASALLRRLSSSLSSAKWLASYCLTVSQLSSVESAIRISFDFYFVPSTFEALFRIIELLIFDRP